MTEENTIQNPDGKADALAATVLIVTLVTTVAFWLLGQ